MEQFRNNRNVKRMKSFEYFISKGKEYMEIADNLHKGYKDISILFPDIIETLDMYTRIKIWLQKDMYNYWHSYDDEDNDEDEDVDMDEEEDQNDDEDVAVGDAEGDDVVFVALENIALDGRLARDFDNFGDFLHENCELRDKILYINVQLAKMKVQIARTQELYAMFLRICLKMCHSLTDYRKRLRIFLDRNARFRRSSKPHRGKNPMHVYRCKYNFLQQMLIRIDKEQKRIARYVITSRNNASGSSNG